MNCNEHTYKYTIYLHKRINLEKQITLTKKQFGNILQYVEFHTLTLILEHMIFYS